MRLMLLFFTSVTFAQTKIALNWKAEPQFGGFYQAVMDSKNTLQVMEGGSGTPTVQMLSFKKVDYAIVSAEEILISNEKNPKNQIVAVFAAFQINPQVLITKADRNLNSIGELMQQPGLIAAQNGLTYVRYLKDKYPDAKVTWVPYLGGISGLIKEKNYAQQGFITSEPLLAEKQNIKVKSFLIADEHFNPYTTVLAVRKGDLEKNKAEIEKVVAQIREGWRKYLADPKPANDAMALINKSMDTDTFKKSAEAQKKLIQPEASTSLGQMNVDRWQSLVDTLYKLKVIRKKLLPADQFQNL